MTKRRHRPRSIVALPAWRPADDGRGVGAASPPLTGELWLLATARMTTAATPKLGAYALCSGLGLLAALAIRRPEPALLAVPFLITLLLGLAGRQLVAFTVSPALNQGRVLEGDDVTLELTIIARTSVERLELLPRLPEGLTAPDGPRVRAIRLARDERRVVLSSLRAAEWGGYALGDTLWRATDRWGLLVTAGLATARLPLRVYPTLERLNGGPAPVWTQAMAGNTVARQSGDGIEFADLRLFAPGDQARRINWRASARSRQLVVNQQHPERNADVVLFLDSFVEGGRSRTGVLSLAVRAAAGLADYYLKGRDRVGLVSFGGYLRWLSPAAGAVQRYRIIEALLDTQIVLTYAWNELTVLPPHTLPPRSLIVALTPLLDSRPTAALQNLAARGFDLVIVEIDPVPHLPAEETAVGALARRLWLLQRDAERTRFRRLGVPLVTWDAGRSLESAIEEARAFQRFARRQRA